MNRVKFGDVVQEIKINVDRTTDDHEYFIAGEHMDSSNIHITRRGRFSESDVGPAFIRLFRPGQVLYGSRRTYLRKVAVADFEGITSNTTFVLETKDSNRLLQELLPYIMLTDRFSEYAINNSKGSTNPYILFKDLAAYEFDLPTIEEQRQLVVLLSACDRAKEAYKRLLKQTDEVVKSQFIEMSTEWQKHFAYEPLSSFMTNITYGFTNPMPDTEIGPWKVTAKDIVNGRVDFSTARKTSQEDFEKLTAKSKPQIDDVLLTKDGTLGRVAIVEQEGLCINQSVAAIRCNERILPRFLWSILQMPEYQEKMLADAGGVTVKHLYITKVDKMLVCVPDFATQQKWLAFIQQSDKSKFVDLQTTISELYTCRIKSLSIYGGQCYAE